MNIKNEIQDVKDSCSIIKSKVVQFKVQNKEGYDSSYQIEYDRDEQLVAQIRILQRMCVEVAKFADNINYNFEKLKQRNTM